jgi:precorrin-6Y C5,15-methyltransferase (decarboxylating)
VKCKVLLFGGTTEGRILSDYLREYDIPHEVSVATEYGGEILRENGEDNLLVGRKSASEIEKVITEGAFTIVVDATHPFATAVSAELRGACEATGVQYLRLKRDTGKELSGQEGIIYVDTLKEAIKELSDTEGNILLLTGSKDLQEIADSFPDKTRLFVRVLPNTDSIVKCEMAGLSGKQIIAMQGPFSRQMNVATIKELHATAILTKESGRTGGLDDKLQAAQDCGVKAVVLKNPENKSDACEGHSIKDILKILSENTGKEIKIKKEITLAGMGPGGEKYFTRELIKELEIADVIFGAQAVLKNIEGINIPKIPEYKGEEINKYLEKNSEINHPLVLFSGDISLCSGAKGAFEYFSKLGYQVKKIPGISSVTIFAERLGLSLENVSVVSAHGRSCNVTWHMENSKELIILPSNPEHAGEICREALEIADSVKAGCDLGTIDEQILDISADSGAIDLIRGKSLIYISNNRAASKPFVRGLSDDEIIRGKTPMTKEEIRALSVRKLALGRNAVFYDIGAGTGSISLEAALLAPEIKVYAIEKDDEAVALLQQNKDKFKAVNMEIIHGKAPQALDLPAPSHVFIGGSSGNMKDILDTVFAKNKDARIVINAVTAETFAEVMDCTKAYPDIEPDIVQIFASRYRKVGKYHLADALNPVYIITLQRGAVDDKA